MKIERGAKGPIRLLLMGEAATGKTGALAQLANAGYRILLHDFDQNSRVIADHLKEGHAPVYVQTYDVARLTNNGMLDTGKAVEQLAVKELNRFAAQLKHWNADGEDLGTWDTWTPKDVVVIDSTTFMSRMLMLAGAQHPKANANEKTIYKYAGEFQTKILSDLTSRNNGASVIVISHLKQTGERDADGNLTGNNIRNIPTGVGVAESKSMPTYFTDIWEIQIGATGKREIKTAATNKTALRASSPLINATEPYDLASMFNRLLGAPT